MRIFRTSLLIFAAALLPGCIAAAIAVGAAAAYGVVQYTENEAFRDYRTDADTTFAAAVSVLRERGHAVPEETDYSVAKGAIDVGDIKLKVTANSAVSSRVTVRVGTFSTDAHKERAAELLDAIGMRIDE